jgi:midasin
VDKLKSGSASATPSKEEGQASKKKRRHIPPSVLEEWVEFEEALNAAERTVAAAEGGFAFAFVEGALVRALRRGCWLLLDEINLAPPEVLLLLPPFILQPMH